MTGAADQTPRAVNRDAPARAAAGGGVGSPSAGPVGPAGSLDPPAAPIGHGDPLAEAAIQQAADRLVYVVAALRAIDKTLQNTLRAAEQLAEDFPTIAAALLSPPPAGEPDADADGDPLAALEASLEPAGYDRERVLADCDDAEAVALELRAARRVVEAARDEFFAVFPLLPGHGRTASATALVAALVGYDQTTTWKAGQ